MNTVADIRACNIYKIWAPSIESFFYRNLVNLFKKKTLSAFSENVTEMPKQNTYSKIAAVYEYLKLQYDRVNSQEDPTNF